MSFFDMIPSEYLTMPSGGNGTANLAHKNFGLLKDKCAYCGETFYRRGREVLYIRYKDKKELHMCSWNHLCRWDEENPPRGKGKNQKTKRERIDEFVRKMAEDRALLDSEEGAQMTQKERQRIRGRMHDRAKKVQALMLELEVSGDEARRMEC